MIEVRFRDAADGFRVSVVGHAGFAERGQPDIVCAAASMLAATLCQCALFWQAEGACKATCVDGEGFTRVQCGFSPGAGETMRTVEDTIYAGFALLADKHPRQVSVWRGRQNELNILE